MFSALSTLPDGLGYKLLNIIFVKPIQLIATPVLVGLSIATESLHYATLFADLSLVFVASILFFATVSILNVPSYLGQLLRTCCRKNKEIPTNTNDAKVEPQDIPASNVANLLPASAVSNNTNKSTSETEIKHFPALLNPSEGRSTINVPEDSNQSSLDDDYANAMD